MAIKLHPSIHVHPGPWLREEVVAPQGINVKDLAAHFGVSRQALSTLMNGRSALSADMAIRFEKAFGISADTIMRMQTAFDIAQARLHESSIHVEPLAA